MASLKTLLLSIIVFICCHIALYSRASASPEAADPDDSSLQKRQQQQHSMLRFGRAGHALLRFGKRRELQQPQLLDYLSVQPRGHAIMRFGKRGAPPTGHQMLYFGKRPHAMMHFGKRDEWDDEGDYWNPEILAEEEKRGPGGEGRSHAMIHFGKRDDEDEISDVPDKKDAPSKNVFLRFG